MIFTNLNKKHIKPILIVVLLAVLALGITGCEQFNQWSPPKSPEEKTEIVEAPPPIAIKTGERAILTIYEHLLSQAESYQAKGYLADFYTKCDNWSAESERFKDGTSLWHVVVDMTSVESWKEKPYWQQASWFVLHDGTVIPSNRFQANALRIEAALQELSPPLHPPATD